MLRNKFGIFLLVQQFMAIGPNPIHHPLPQSQRST